MIPGRAPYAIGFCAVVSFALIVALDEGNPLRTTAGMAAVVLLPGTAILSAVPRGWELRRIELGGFAVALSIGTTVLVTVLLDFAGIRIGTTSWAIALVGVTLISCVAALRPRRDGAPISDSTNSSNARKLAGIAPGQLVAVALILVFLIAATVLTSASIDRRDERVITEQLWALPGESGSAAVTIGLSNSGDQRTYMVRLRQGSRLLQSFRARVGHGEGWTRRVTVPGIKGRLTVDSIREGATPEARRRAEVTVG